MFWSSFLHFYQPPTQSKHWIDKITGECYRRLVQGFLEKENLKATFNINALLFEFWEEYGHQDVIEGLRKLLSRGQIELTGTAKYHPLLPKVPEEEIRRQIKLNDETSKRVLGDLYAPVGFFPPEMGYNRKVARVAADLGYEWIIAEELSLNHKFGEVDYSTIYEVEDIPVNGKCQMENGKLLRIFFREREVSYQILSGQLATPEPFKKALSDRLERKNHYLLTAMDGETFGHHRPGMDKLLFDLLGNAGLETVLVSELPELIEGQEVVETQPSTWALMRHDIEKNVPFARWDDPENEIHGMQWELTELAIETVNGSEYKLKRTKYDPPARLAAAPAKRAGGPSSKRKGSNMGDSKEFGACNFEFGISGHDKGELTENQKQWLKARKLLDKALHSDQYWWSSAKPWWSLEMIERGAHELLKAVKAAPDAPAEKKERAQELYYQIITTGFEWQRKGKVEEMSRREDEAVRMRTDEGIPELSNKEIDKMIEPIREEMLEAAEKKEYERAAQLRDRIQELEGYKKETGD